MKNDKIENISIKKNILKKGSDQITNIFLSVTLSIFLLNPAFYNFLIYI